MITNYITYMEVLQPLMPVVPFCLRCLINERMDSGFYRIGAGYPSILRNWAYILSK